AELTQTRYRLVHKLLPQYGFLPKDFKASHVTDYSDKLRAHLAQLKRQGEEAGWPKDRSGRFKQPLCAKAVAIAASGLPNPTEGQIEFTAKLLKEYGFRRRTRAEAKATPLSTLVKKKLGRAVVAARAGSDADTPVSAARVAHHLFGRQPTLAE